MSSAADIANRTASNDAQSALLGGGIAALLQIRVYARNSTGANATGLFQATAPFPNVGNITIPGITGPNGPVYLGDTGDGYPASLYPNITYTTIPGTPDSADPSVNATLVSAFADFPLNTTSTPGTSGHYKSMRAMLYFQ